MGNPYLFTGRRLDEETGFYYYRARMYDSELGRFVSRDPIGQNGGSRSLYQYVRSYPIGSGDPLGLSDWFEVIPPDLSFPPIHIDPPNIPGGQPPVFPPPIDGNPLDVVPSTCEAFKDQYKNNETFTKLPAIKTLIECNVNVYCGNCGKYDGMAHYTEKGGYMHLCLDSEKLKGANVRVMESLLLHEAVHFGQYLAKGECGCKTVPWQGPPPPLPPQDQVGGGNCTTCTQREHPAYDTQARYLYPPEWRGSDAYYDAFSKAGVCSSCGHLCPDLKTYHGPQGMTCPPFPEIPPFFVW